ncbi:hypothetical protein ANRL4_02040 [Anaerolineae bacterium]|nr:hypothetical protein ANRL4_02040 [Anaerolineae bacterium]
MAAKQDNKPHLVIPKGQFRKSEHYVAPPIKVETKLPKRAREKHGPKLASEFQAAVASFVEAKDPARRGALVRFESAKKTPLKLESMDLARQGIELLSASKQGEVENATVFVPSAKLNHFPKLFNQYATQETETGKPKNQPLAAPIETVALVKIDDLWTDDPKKMPGMNDVRWHELWLRWTEAKRFRAMLKTLGVEATETETKFFDRTVVLVKCALETLGAHPELMECIAEVRIPPVASTFFLDLPASEQATWVDDLIKRTNRPDKPKATVCLLDGGVNPGHKLLKNLVRTPMAYPGTQTHDVRKGHGTGMAGLILYGDLLRALASPIAVTVPHVVESVRILPHTGQNEPKDYGSITVGAVSLAEQKYPHANRVVCMPVTDRNTAYRGQPTSWSAAIDELASDALGGGKHPRLVIVSAGNLVDDAHLLKPTGYSAANETTCVHDPAQAWNALAVGASADRIDPAEAGWHPIAKRGDLHPNSTTGVNFQSKWPLKPDILMPGGNHAHDGKGKAAALASLQLATTHHQPALGQQFTSFGDTSAASALAANAAAYLMAEYPNFWPETIRGLLVHSASWSKQMLSKLAAKPKKQDIRNLVTTCGFGIGDLDRARWSASNHLTLVVQDELHPYRFSGGNKTNDMHLHQLPWPKKVLQGLGSAQVQMRVTLSYFVEPYPARKQYRDRYQYMSHSLNFETKAPDEKLDAFRKRVNKEAREEGDSGLHDSDANFWQLGTKARKAGSLHSDIWSGTAAELAEAGVIAVYPGGGWWRERSRKDGYYTRAARYSLLVSIYTEKQDVDLYTPVENLIKLPIKV